MASNQHKLDAVLDIIKSNNFNRDDTLDLIKCLTDIYQSEVNNIIQKIPREIWSFIIDFVDKKKEIQIYISLRLVNKTWNDTIQNFTRITIMHPYKLTCKYCELFPKVQTLTTNSRYNSDVSFLTNLKKLELIGTESYDAWNRVIILTNLKTLSLINYPCLFDGDLRCLTNLTKLKLHETYITSYSLQYLTNLKRLIVPVTYQIENEHISHLMNLNLTRYDDKNL